MDAKTIRKLRLDSKPYRPYKTDVKRWTAVLNHLLFQGELPPYRTITLRKMKYFAMVECHESKRSRYCSIELRDEFSSFGAFFSILAHELVHVADWVQRGTTQCADHGKFFYSHREMLKTLGIRLQRTY
jgi:hypothetical protein